MPADRRDLPLLVTYGQPWAACGTGEGLWMGQVFLQFVPPRELVTTPQCPPLTSAVSVPKWDQILTGGLPSDAHFLCGHEGLIQSLGVPKTGADGQWWLPLHSCLFWPGPTTS